MGTVMFHCYVSNRRLFRLDQRIIDGQSPDRHAGELALHNFGV